MLIKVTAVFETVVCVDTDNFGTASIQARKIIANNGFQSLREDLENLIFDEIPLATQKIEKIEELPNGWDGGTIPWSNDDHESNTCAKELGIEKCSECGK